MPNIRERNRKTEDHSGRRVDLLGRFLRQKGKHGAGRLLIDVLAGPGRQHPGRYCRWMISDAPYRVAMAQLPTLAFRGSKEFC